MEALIAKARENYHKELIRKGVLVVTPDGIASNADADNHPSKVIAGKVAERLGAPEGKKLGGQTAGRQFEKITAQFLRDTFPKLQHLRPGAWTVLDLGNSKTYKASDYTQYEHLIYLDQLTKENKKLSTLLGNDYMITPDIVIYRDLYEDEEINADMEIISDEICRNADLRKKNGGKPILHASISLKWTMRTDRAQNSRTEALNLIRNRKGRLPHIVAVTGGTIGGKVVFLGIRNG